MTRPQRREPAPATPVPATPAPATPAPARKRVRAPQKTQAQNAQAPKAQPAKAQAPKTQAKKAQPQKAQAPRAPFDGQANGHRPGNGRRQATVDASVNGHAPRAPRPAAVAVPPLAPAEPEPTSTVEATAGPDVWEERVADALAFLRRRITGRYDVDDFGFDPELTDTVFYPLLRLLYRHYFRVEVIGAENLPVDGRALLVSNHSGTVPVDSVMLSIAVHDETPTHRHLRLLAADLVFRVPVLSELARKGGATLACNPDAERLLGSGELVGVFPEGFKGVGKHYRDRYKLQRFGRGGFVSAAVRTGAPIVPVSIVGAEEIYPIVGNMAPLAKVLGLPYLPVTPLFPWLGPLGLLPLPSKWLIEFGTPIPTADLTDDADDPIVVFNLADQVRETIQQTLHALLERRPDPFS